MKSRMKQVLFLCSANYYRSRFAELLFNHLALEAGLAWQADSRGVLVGHWGDVGAIAAPTVDALQAEGVPINGEHREPRALTLPDLEASALVVAVKELEHRSEIGQQFPEWVDRVEYWDVHDLDCATPEESLPYLKQKVHALVERLSDSD